MAFAATAVVDCSAPNVTTGGTAEYYRYPCVPITRPGGTEEWVNTFVNGGNIPVTRLAAIDVLPRANDRGVIVNLSSAAAKLGSPNQYVDYAAAKGAIDTFTVGLAREVATEGVRVNAIRPGIIDTDIHTASGEPDRAQTAAGMIPMKRAGRADGWVVATLALVTALANGPGIVGMDISEIAPIEGFVAPQFSIARLIYRMLGRIRAGRRVH